MPPTPKFPPAYEYHYWKCYYPPSQRTGKASSLYSIEVDYYNFGECRLVGGSYFCGAMATRMPYKSLLDTREATTESLLGQAPASTSAKATGHSKYVAADYAAVQKAKNPDFYTPVGGGGSYPTATSGTSHYDTNPVNNGQETETHTTHETTNTLRPGITATYHNGYDHDVAWKATDTNTASNYAMTPTAAALYNGGVHVAQGMTNAEYAATHSHTNYALRGGAY